MDGWMGLDGDAKLPQDCLNDRTSFLTQRHEIQHPFFKIIKQTCVHGFLWVDDAAALYGEILELL